MELSLAPKFQCRKDYKIKNKNKKIMVKKTLLSTSINVASRQFFSGIISKFLNNITKSSAICLFNSSFEETFNLQF